MIARIVVPNINYTIMHNVFQFKDNNLFHFLTTPDNAVLLKIDLEESKLQEILYPGEYDYDFHYNIDLKKKVIKEAPDSKKEEEIEIKSIDCFQNDPTMGSQILYRAIRYRDVQWNAAASNAPNGNMNNCNTRVNIRSFYSPPLNYDYYVTTPLFNTTAANTGMCYKWGGFTHINSFILEVNNNKIVGDTQSDSDLSCNQCADCGDTFSCGYEHLDTRVIGIDCSGFISRAWNRNTKFGTTTLPNISPELSNFSLLRRGDIINNLGSHVCLVRDNNSTLTSVNVIEAHGSGRVRNHTYSNSGGSNMLQGYIPRRYNSKLPYDLHFTNFQVSESPIHEQEPINLSVTINNAGAQGFAGNVRAMVYPTYANPNTNVLGAALFQIGNAANTTVAGNGGSVILNFSIDQIPPEVAAGTYLIAIEHNLTGNCWPKIPRHDYAGLQQIIIVPPVPPVADFSYSPTVGDFPLSVQFTDASTGNPTEWGWSFGDGGTSTQQNPLHVYNSPGIYNVSLTVAKNGLIDTKNISITLEEGLGAYFSASPMSGVRPLSVSFTDKSTGSPSQWYWNFGDGNSSTAQNPTYVYNSTGNFPVTLSVSKNGNTVTSTPLTISVVENMISVTGRVRNAYTWDYIYGATVTFSPEGSISYTNANGVFVNNIPSGWQGTIIIEKDGSSYTDKFYYANNIGPFYNNTDLGTISIFPLNNHWNITYEKLSAYLYKFTAQGQSTNSSLFNWSFQRLNEMDYYSEYANATTVVPVIQHSFPSVGKYKIVLNVEDGIASVGPFSVEMNVTGNYEASFSYLDNDIHRTVRLGQLASILDLSGPFNNIGRAVINHQWAAGDSSADYYFKDGTERCNTSIGKKYPESRILGINYASAGFKESSFAVGGYNCEKDPLVGSSVQVKFIVVDCSEIATSDDFSNAISKIYSWANYWWCGSFELNKATIPEVNNPNSNRIDIAACNEIRLLPGFHSKPNGANFFKLRIDNRLHLTKEYSSQEFLDGENKIINSFEIDIEGENSCIIYPNPNNGYFLLRLLGSEESIKKITIYDTKGFVAKKYSNVNEQSHYVDIQDKPNGIYLLIVETICGNTHIMKVVKIIQ